MIPILSPPSTISFLPLINRLTKRFSAAAFFVFDIIFHFFYLQSNISFLSSLEGWAFIFCTLLALPGKTYASRFNRITLEASLLVKLLPVFFVLLLVTIPLAQSMGASYKLIRYGIVVVGASFLRSWQLPGLYWQFKSPKPEVISIIHFLMSSFNSYK